MKKWRKVLLYWVIFDSIIFSEEISRKKEEILDFGWNEIAFLQENINVLVLFVEDWITDKKLFLSYW